MGYCDGQYLDYQAAIKSGHRGPFSGLAWSLMPFNEEAMSMHYLGNIDCGVV